jgi:tetratricopeptide (TPR) repeat protein
MKAVLAAACAIFAVNLCAATETGWSVARSAHFEVYSHSGERNGRDTLGWLERLRGFFLEVGLAKPASDLDRRGLVRVIGLESEREYEAYRTRPSADAYALMADGRDYLVFPELGAREFGVAAHEYAHVVLHSLNVPLPPWLAEGLAEFFSTVRIGDRECTVGGDLPQRTMALRQNTWIQMRELLAGSPDLQLTRSQRTMFYAESWAFADMLITSPEYAAHFGDLMASLAVANPDAATLGRVYQRDAGAIFRDLESWTRRPRHAVPLPGVPKPDEAVRVNAVSDFEANAVLADLLLVSGKLDEAQAAYQRLAKERPDDADVHAALGQIALRKRQPDVARREWKRAMELGIADAALCYQYANLAEDAGVDGQEVRAALRKAIDLQPEFDDARYKLALLDNNVGDYEAALQQFRAMRWVPAQRGYGYWTAFASALMETDQREEAKQAAMKALRYATTAEERNMAVSMGYMAETDLTVQFARDRDGNLKMVTARKPHGSDDWNPFVEAGDSIRRMDGQIRRVQCSGGKITGFEVGDSTASVNVTVADPSHILIRGGTPEFVCGAEDGRAVEIQYAVSAKAGAADGVLRGIRFR